MGVRERYIKRKQEEAKEKEKSLAKSEFSYENVVPESRRKDAYSYENVVSNRIVAPSSSGVRARYMERKAKEQNRLDSAIERNLGENTDTRSAVEFLKDLAIESTRDKSGVNRITNHVNSNPNDKGFADEYNNWTSDKKEKFTDAMTSVEKDAKSKTQKSLMPGKAEKAALNVSLARDGYTQEEINAINDRIAKYQNEKTAESEAKFMEDLADSGVMGKVAASAGSIAQNATGILGFTDIALQKLMRKTDPFTGGKSEFDYNTELTRPAIVASEARKAVSKDMSGVGSFVYNVGMNMADMLVARNFGAGSKLSLALMSGSAATNASNEAHKRGANDTQALGVGAIAGALEAALESLSLDNLNSFKMIVSNVEKTTLKTTFVQSFLNWLKQAGIEGFEEGATTVGNTIADALIMGDKSEYNTSIRNYMANGLSEKEATKKANVDWLSNLALDVAGGLISGGVMGGYATVANNYETNRVIGNEYRDSVEGLIENGLESPENSKSNRLAVRAQNRLNAGKILSDTDVANLASANEWQIIGEDGSAINEAVTKRLTELGETGDVATISKAITKQVINQYGSEIIDNGDEIKSVLDKKLTRAERKAISESKYATRVLNELNPENIASGEFTSEWAKSINTNRVNADTYSLIQKETATESNVADYDSDTKEITAEPKSFTTETENALNREFEASEDTIKTMESTLAERGLQPEAIEQVVSAYESGDTNLSPAEFTVAVNEAFKYGMYNLQDIKNTHYASELQPELMQFVYNSGKLASMTSVNAKSGAIVTAKKGGKSKGQIRFVGNVKSSIKGDKLRGVSMSVIKDLQKVLGNDWYIFKSIEKADGKRYWKNPETGKMEECTHNGFYKSNDGSIWIDINSGNFGQGVMLYTAAHEITHFARDWSPKEFKVLADFLIENYGENGKSVQELIEDKLKSLRRSGQLNGKTEAQAYDLAYEEVVANAMESMFKDGEVAGKLRVLANRDATVFEKFMEAIRKFVASIKSLYSKHSTESEAGQQVEQFGEDIIKQLQEKFLDAIVVAGENFKGSDTTSIELQPVTKYSYNMQTVIEGYLDSVNNEILEYATEVRNDKNTKFRRIKINDVSQRQVEDVKRLLGRDITGYENYLETFSINHVERRHGVNGEADSSMSDLNDLARVGFILHEYDDVKIIEEADGNPRYSKLYRDNTGNFAPLIMFTKKINGTYYAAIACPESKWKRLWLVSAYIGNKKSSQVTQTSNAESPESDVRNANASPIATNNKVADGENSVKKFSERIQKDSEGKMLSKQQIEFFKYSKVVDENGNLKVMYHGTEESSFHKFMNELSDDGLSFFFVDTIEGAKGYSGTHDVYSAKSFKTANDLNSYLKEINADEYEVRKVNDRFALYENGEEVATSATAGGIYEEFRDWTGIGLGSANYKVYLNLTNPLIIDAKNNNWDELDKASTQNKKIYNTISAKVLPNGKISDYYWNESDKYIKGEMSEREFEKTFGSGFFEEVVKNDGEFNTVRERLVINADAGEEILSTTREYARYAKDNGYDGVIINNVIDTGLYASGMERFTPSTVAIAFNSNQIKSVENNAPTKDADIRYSERDPEMAAKKREINSILEKENAELKEEVKYLSELLKLQRTVTGGTKFTRSSLNLVAGTLRNYANAVRGNKADFVKLLTKTYEDIASSKNISWEEFVEYATPTVDWLMENRTISKELDAHAKDILDTLRSKTVYLDDTQKREVANYYDSYNDYRKRMMGNITLSNDASTSLDSLWQEMAELYPNEFDKNINPLDMPMELLRIKDALRNSTNSDYFEYSDDMLRQDLIQQVYDNYWRVSTLYTVADAKQKEINKLKIKHFEQMAKIRQKHKDQTEKLKKRYQESRKKGIDSRNRTALRNKIKHVVHDLNKLLLNPTKEKHVPEVLQKAVAEALDVINFDTVNAAERIKKYDELIANETNQIKRESLIETRDRIREQGENLAEKLNKLKVAYDSLKGSGNEDSHVAFDDVINSLIDETVELVGDTPLSKMNSRQLESVYDMYKAVLKYVRDANKAFTAERNQTISDIAIRSMDEVKSFHKDKYLVSDINKMLSKYGFSNLKPQTAFNLIGSDTFSSVLKGAIKGEGIYATDIHEGKLFYENVAKKHNVKKWDMKKSFKFTSTNGKKFTLDLQQIMSLYAYSKREQADLHLEQGGFVFGDDIKQSKEKNGKKSIRKYSVNIKNAHTLSRELLVQITDSLTAEQKAFVDEMQDYLSNEMANKGNEISLKMYGIKLFKEKHYFPLKSSRAFMASQNEETAAHVRLKNSGFSKKTVKFANNPIILDNFIDVWAKHVNDMSMYHAMVLPLEDLNRVFSYNNRGEDGKGNATLKQHIENALGQSARDYVEQLINDLNGGARVDSMDSLLSKGISTFKKSATLGSTSVIIQQGTSLPRTYAYIDPKYFVGRKMKADETMKLWDEMKKYAPVCIIKEMGSFDMNVGASTKDYIAGVDYSGVKGKVDWASDKLAYLPGKVDEITWARIWYAVKRETLAKHPGMKVNSEEFLQLCGDRFTEVITKTQVYDSVLSRSQMMRSKSGLVKMATAFMAEPTTIMNMVVDAYVDHKKGVKHAYTKTIGAVGSSIILNAVLSSLIYAARDDDEDKTWLDRYLKSVSGEFVDNLNPLTYLPLAKDIYSLAQGYDVERSDLAVWADLIKATTKLSKNLIDGDAEFDNFIDVISSTVDLLGIPASNVKREIETWFRFFKDFGNNKPESFTATTNAVVEGCLSQIPVANKFTQSKAEKLYEGYLKNDKAYIERITELYADEKKAMQAVSGVIKKKYQDGEITLTEAKYQLKVFCGMDSDAIDKRIKDWNE